MPFKDQTIEPDQFVPRCLTVNVSAGCPLQGVDTKALNKAFEHFLLASSVSSVSEQRY